MGFLRAGDELVVHRLDRLSRSTRDVLNLVHELDASLRILELEVAAAGDMGRMVIAVLGMVADMELKFIRETQGAEIIVEKASAFTRDDRSGSMMTKYEG